MVTSALVDSKIDRGAELVSALDSAHVPVDAAFWLYSAERADWRLIIASPVVDEVGPRRAYKRLQTILTKTPAGLELTLDDISMVSPRNNTVVRLIRSAVRTGRTISRIRFTNNVVNGTLIDDALIYRVA